MSAGSSKMMSLRDAILRANIWISAKKTLVGCNPCSSMGQALLKQQDEQDIEMLEALLLEVHTKSKISPITPVCRHIGGEDGTCDRCGERI